MTHSGHSDLVRLSTADENERCLSKKTDIEFSSALSCDPAIRLGWGFVPKILKPVYID